MPLLYKEIAFELIKDNNFIEELTVDLFAFGHAVGAVLASSDSKLMLANMLAAITVNSWYIEYAQRLDTYSINPEASDKKERIALCMVNYVQQSLRVKAREHFILTYLKDISDDKESMKLYQNLTTSVYSENNGELDIDFLKDLDKYYITMRSGNNFQTNNLNRDSLELKMETVESEIIRLLSDSLESEHKI